MLSEILFCIFGILFSVRLSFFESVEPVGETSKHTVVSELVVSLLILNEPAVRSSLVVMSLENKVIAVTALSELSMLVWRPIHGPELSMLRNGGQPAVAQWQR
jgi:hypothetical protein